MSDYWGNDVWSGGPTLGGFAGNYEGSSGGDDDGPSLGCCLIALAFAALIVWIMVRPL